MTIPLRLEKKPHRDGRRVYPPTPNIAGFDRFAAAVFDPGDGEAIWKHPPEIDFLPCSARAFVD